MIRLQLSPIARIAIAVGIAFGIGRVVARNALPTLDPTLGLLIETAIIVVVAAAASLMLKRLFERSSEQAAP